MAKDILNTNGQRLKVLLSAYACEPAKGSEPEVGWQWALQMARFHDVVVLTRSNNRASIEAGLLALPLEQPVPRFIYHDGGTIARTLKRTLGAHRLYYTVWQQSAQRVVTELLHRETFDLLHHITFASFRYRTAIWKHSIPCIWGPIGGMESIPWPLLPWRHPLALFHEIVRNLSNIAQVTPFHILPERANLTSLILVSTEETQRAFTALGVASTLLPTVGLHLADFPEQEKKNTPNEPLRLLFVGQVILLKGVDLMLHALAASGTTAELTLIGDGSFLTGAKQLAHKLGLSSRVHFLGRKPREEVLHIYPQHDVFLFPSLHDSGGFAVLEAMAHRLPVICLDCGGPAISVTSACGVKVNLGSAKKVIAGLADAIRHYDTDRPLIPHHGQAAREIIRHRYDWDLKGEAMSALYQKATTTQATHPRHVIQPRGLAFGFLLLLLVGILGFLSLESLKTKARDLATNTIPALAYIGSANSSLDQAFARILPAILAETPAESERSMAELQRYSAQTTDSLEHYKTTNLDPEEAALFNTLTQNRNAYLTTRTQVLALVSQDKKAEAMQLYHVTLLPSFTSYKRAGDTLLAYDSYQGQTEGHAIIHLCKLTQLLVATVAVLLFAIGFIFGFFK